jgi:hypothetical protein
MSNNFSTFFSKDKDAAAPEPKTKESPSRPKNNKTGRQGTPRIPSMCFDGACDIASEDNDEDIVNNEFDTAAVAIDRDRRASRDHIRRTSASVSNQPKLNIDRPTDFNRKNSFDEYSTATSSAIPSTASISTGQARYSTRASSRHRSNASRSKDSFRTVTRDLLGMDSSRSTAGNGMLGDFSPLDPAKYSPPPSASDIAELPDAYES